ncbi:MAG: putative nucleotidyltransferase substrate binding domain-containing protein [Syntrophaceae bacterium]|nr:putative nucleotidyltransferase substrate binding domain-containing protein [Syntrophaceae bacterium]
MSTNSEFHFADPISVVHFLKRVVPFNELENITLRKIAGRIILDFFPRGARILEQGVSEVKYVYFIQKGGVRIETDDPAEGLQLKDMREETDYFGILSIISGGKSIFDVTAIEDTFCYLLDRDTFMDLIRERPNFAAHLWERLSRDSIGQVYEQIRSEKLRPRAEDGLRLFNAPIKDVIKRSIETILAADSIQKAAGKMSQDKIGSLLVVDTTGEVVGIITDNDLRNKVVAKGVDPSVSVGSIMSAPVKTISEESICFDALVEMMHSQTHHLAVSGPNGITGVISAHDIMVDQGDSPISLYREIVAQKMIEGLYPLSRKMPFIVRSLILEGAKANDVTRMISILNDHIVSRVIYLLDQELGPAPYHFCWLTMGSEGRREQTFKTDQDNALIYETPPEGWDYVKDAKLYFRRFGNIAIKHLAACGYPLCKGEIMASNPKWRKPYAVWRNYFDNWMNAPEPQAVLHATIFFDFRGGYGEKSLAEKLRDYIVNQAPNRGIFLMHLARDCISTKSPLSFFKNFLVEKDGKYKNRLDLKTRGLVPFVDFARVLALRHGLRQTNTLDRIATLGEHSFIPNELYSETREAYEFQMQIRLVHQLRMIEEGKQPDNYIDPSELTDREKHTLKDAFEVINRIQGYLKNEFRVLE